MSAPRVPNTDHVPCAHSTAARTGGLPALVAIVAIASLAAQQPPEDRTWTRRPGGSAYQVVRELSGRIELTQFSARPNPRSLQSVCDSRREGEQMALETYESQVKELAAGGITPETLGDYLQVRHGAAQSRAYIGDMVASAAHLRAALDAASRVAGPEGRERAERFLVPLIGVAELRRGELENCVEHRNPDRCIFPLIKPGEHERTAGSAAALEAFLDALRSAPDDLELRWLANIAAMTLGKHPEGVPARHRIDASRFAAADGFPRMVDGASELGLDLSGRAGGAVADDFDGDGRLDLAITSVDPCEPIHLLRQQEDGRFVDVADAAGLGSQLGGINLTQTDYDNDGHLDLFVMRGGWELPMRNSLLRNRGDGTFEDVTEAAGLLDIPHRTHSAAWADFDNDGWLDLFVGHEESPSRLFRNNGDGTFTDVARAAGISLNAFVKGVAWGDFDRDGHPDLYVSNYGEPNVLYRNNGEGTFTDVTLEMGVGGPAMSFPTWFFDYDNDGWPDIFVAGFVPSVTEAVKHYVDRRPSAETMRLYRNDAGQGFVDVTTEAGLDRVVLAMGANFGDVDSDGWLDFYLGTGAPSYSALVPNLLFRNLGGRSFADVTASSGTGHLQKGHGVSFADVDADGDLDLFVNIGGFTPGDSYARALFRNPGNGNAWLGVRLRGVRTNRLGLGARVTVTATDSKGTRRTIPRVVTTGGSFGSSPVTLHIGLGAADRVEAVEVYWPVSATTQVVRDVPIRRTIELVEQEAGWRDVTRHEPGLLR